MSNAINQPMSPDTAFATLCMKDYAPAFFEKLANVYGIHPQNEEEAARMLAQAARLRAAYDAMQEKQASTSNLLDVVDASLNQHVPPGDDSALKQAAAREAANDPERVSAVLSLLSAAQAVQ